ncbi:MAG TPA: hypothetical protein VF718_05390 [Allosphingosinicella sp.]|jgi:hypothetical protein
MSAIDVNAVGSEAAKKIIEILTGAGKDVVSYAQIEGKKLAQSAAEIAQLRLTGQITDAEMKLHIRIQKNASISVLMAIKGISKIAVEQAINAALKIIGTAVKGATGLPFPV